MDIVVETGLWAVWVRRLWIVVGVVRVEDEGNEGKKVK